MGNNLSNSKSKSGSSPKNRNIIDYNKCELVKHEFVFPHYGKFGTRSVKSGMDEYVLSFDVTLRTITGDHNLVGEICFYDTKFNYVELLQENEEKGKTILKVLLANRKVKKCERICVTIKELNEHNILDASINQKKTIENHGNITIIENIFDEIVQIKNLDGIKHW